MKVKDGFFKQVYFKVGNGESNIFWEDKLLGDAPLSQQYTSLFNIVERK
jgi:hypothetical protein